jgi:hypothetical protein
MSTLFVRSLLLACGIVAAFPPGWCCLLPARQIETAAAPSQQSCCHPRQTEHPNPPAERLPPIRTCCCDLNDSALPSEIDAPQSDSAASTALLVLDVDLPGLISGVEVGPSVPVSRSLQLLHCLWRC